MYIHKQYFRSVLTYNANQKRFWGKCLGEKVTICLGLPFTIACLIHRASNNLNLRKFSSPYFCIKSYWISIKTRDSFSTYTYRKSPEIPLLRFLKNWFPHSHITCFTDTKEEKCPNKSWYPHTLMLLVDPSVAEHVSRTNILACSQIKTSRTQRDDGARARARTTTNLKCPTPSRDNLSTWRVRTQQRRVRCRARTQPFRSSPSAFPARVARARG